MGDKINVLDPALFAEGPARDFRFVVKDRWAECVNLPDDHPERVGEFLHRQMNEEINGMENAARSLVDFPDAEWGVRMCLARQCCDEARHVIMFRELFSARGVRLGQYPVMNFQYRIITRLPSLVGRLAVQNRSFEADGIDAIGFGVEEARGRGDEPLAELMEAQLADEITHVRFANDYIREALRKDPRVALRMGAALTAGSRAFRQVMGEEGTNVVKYTVDPDARREAGFDQHEVEVAASMASARRARSGDRDEHSSLP